MRILPLPFYIAGKPPSDRYRLTQQVSALTHRHVRSVMSCFICLEFAGYIISGMDKNEAYASLRSVTPGLLESFGISQEEIRHFDRILRKNIFSLPPEEIASDGYVVHTLEAALWCVMKTSSYKKTILKAVNLGRDTDTTAAVAGGLAGLLYGYESIPEEWLSVIARSKEIEKLAERLELRSVEPLQH